MRVAIVHYWLVGMRGGEKVLEAMCELYPSADIFTHVVAPESISATIAKHRIFTSFIARLVDQLDGQPSSKRPYAGSSPVERAIIRQLARG
jgi:hypothetical protein